MESDSDDEKQLEICRNENDENVKQFDKPCKMISEYCQICKIYTYFIYMDKYYDPKEPKLCKEVNHKVCVSCFGKDYMLNDHCCYDDYDDDVNDINLETIDYNLSNDDVDLLKAIVNGHKLYFSPLASYNHYDKGSEDEISCCSCIHDTDYGQTHISCDICAKNNIHHTIKLEPPIIVFSVIEIHDMDFGIYVSVITNNVIHIIAKIWVLTYK
jgi:hypothetical protein